MKSKLVCYLLCSLVTVFAVEEFIPSSEWQVVKDGQHIPPGLEIRLDLENMQREARIPLAGEKQLSNIKNHEIVVVQPDSDITRAIDALTHGDYSSIDYLVDESSDIEHGVIIAKNANKLLPLLEIKQLSHDIYKIIAASLRNNVDAQHEFGNIVHIQKFMDGLLDLQDVRKENTKIKLSVLGALVGNGTFQLNNELKTKLLVLYVQANEEALRHKIINILNDGEGDVKRRFCEVAEEALPTATLNKNTWSVLRELARLKQEERKLFKAGSKFLDWLDVNINLLRSEADTVPLRELIRYRHEVFGNRFGSRRDDLDEL